MKITMLSAFSRVDVKKNIMRLSIPIIRHLLKVMKWDDPVNYSKHIDDIDQWLFEIYVLKMKPNNKTPNAGEFFKWLYDPYSTAEDINKMLVALNAKYKLPVLRTNEQIHIELPRLYKALATDLANGTFVSIQSYLKNI